MKATEPTGEPLNYIPMLTRYHQEQLREMEANEYKGGWHDMTPEQLMYQIHDHVSKLHCVVEDRADDLVREYAADVGNLCAMLLDVTGETDE